MLTNNITCILNQNPYQNAGQSTLTEGFSNNLRYYGDITAEEFNTKIGSSWEMARRMSGAASAVALDDPLQGVREVVSAITEARPLPTQRNLNELFKQAAASRGTPADVEAWANKLAGDSGDLND
jgi:hypothetical protein